MKMTFEGKAPTFFFLSNKFKKTFGILRIEIETTTLETTSAYLVRFNWIRGAIMLTQLLFLAISKKESKECNQK